MSDIDDKIAAALAEYATAKEHEAKADLLRTEAFNEVGLGEEALDRGDEIAATLQGLVPEEWIDILEQENRDPREAQA